MSRKRRHPGRSARLVLLTCLALVLLGGLARAGEQTGKLLGTVLTPDGAPLPKAPVRLTGASLQGERRVETDADGAFLFLGLPPGKYRVEVDPPAYLPFAQDELRVTMGGTLTLEVVLVSAAADETVIIHARRPLIDRERTSLSQSYGSEVLDDVPIGRSYQSVTRLAPGVVIVDDDSNPNIHGGAYFSNQYLLDGVNTTDPVTGTYAANINYDAIQEFQILSGGLDAEYGQSMGGVINLVTKSGGNRFALDTTLTWQPDFLNLKDDFEKDRVGQNDAFSANLNVGGPVVRDRLWYFASVEWKSRLRALSVIPADGSEPATLPGRAWTSLYYLGKLTFQAAPRHKLILLLQGDPYWVDNNLQDPRISREAEQRRIGTGSIATLTWEALWSERLFQKTQIGFLHTGGHNLPQSGCTDVDDPDCRGHRDLSFGTTTGNALSDLDEQRYRLQLDTALTTYLFHLLGTHEWKAGLQYYHAWSFKDELIPGGGSYQDRQGAPYRLTEMARDEQGRFEALSTELQGDTASAFLQDSWKLGRRIVLRPGVRLDYATNRDDRGKLVTEFLTLSPRVNAVWDVTGDGKTVLRLGYNRYVDTGALYLSDRVTPDLKTNIWQYREDTGGYDDLVRSEGGRDSTFIRKDMTAPHTDEVDFQLEREVGDGLSVGLAGIWREFSFLFESAEANYVWNQEGTDVIGLHNGEAGPVYGLGTYQEARRRYYALELLVKKELRDRFQLQGSYTFSRAEGTTESKLGTFMDNYRMNDLFFGFASFDRRHVVKLEGSYRFPWGLKLGSIVTWGTGVPYDQWFPSDYTGAYSVLRAPRGTDADHPGDPYWNRYPDQLNISLKLLFDLQPYTGQKLELFTEVQNLLHLRAKTAVEEHVTPPEAPTRYGEFQAYHTGFQAALGLRYRL